MDKNALKKGYKEFLKSREDPKLSENTCATYSSFALTNKTLATLKGFDTFDIYTIYQSRQS